MDAQIWYAIFSTLFGGIHGAFSHLGEVSIDSSSVKSIANMAAAVIKYRFGKQRKM